MIGINKSLVFGVGINDVNEPTNIKSTPYERYGSGKFKYRQDVYYSKWTSMLQRCYSTHQGERAPSYKGCTVCEEWLLFSNFRQWLVVNKVKGCLVGELHLDKDLLYYGNKVYSPEACTLLPRKINNFIREYGGMGGELLVGVKRCCDTQKYISTCRNPLKDRNRGKHVGSFDTEVEAHLAWKKRKYEIAEELIDHFPEIDERAKAALYNRYKNYTIVEEHLS